MGIVSPREKFFDPDAGPGSGLEIVLRHVPDQMVDAWFMDKRIAYHDDHLGVIAVPRNKDTFVTDLTSVPQLFTWLVPRTGSHLAAALVHDALTPPFSEAPLPDFTGPSAVTQVQADRVMRDGMRDLGTPRIRRWLVWSAISIPTAYKVNRVQGILAYVSLAAIAVIGWFATLDLFDQGAWLFWMGSRPWNRELLFGGLMAVVVASAFALLWPRGVRTAGLITGVSIAALLHVTVAVGAVSFGYQLAEFGPRVWAPSGTAKHKLLSTMIKVGVTLAAGGVGVLTVLMCRWY